MRRRFRESSEGGVTFDFAPMVDIVLLLLIFFFLTSSLGARQNALPLDLPRASTTVRETPELPIVSVDRSGKIFLNGKETTLTRLGGRLEPLVKSSGGLVGLRADEAVALVLRLSHTEAPAPRSRRRPLDEIRSVT